jgi:hypothetical protein
LTGEQAIIHGGADDQLAALELLLARLQPSLNVLNALQAELDYLPMVRQAAIRRLPD